MAELGQLGEGYEAIRQRGFASAGVSSGGVEDCRKLQEKLRLPFPLLADEELELAETLGLVHVDGHRGRDIFRPGTLLADARGRIRWTHQPRHHQSRATLEEVLEAMDAFATPLPALGED